AAVIIVGVFALAVVGGTAFFIYRHVNTQFTNETNAGQEFATARARFSGQQPLIELRRGSEPVLHRDLIAGAQPSPKKIQSLPVIAYADDQGKIVTVQIPLWTPR